MSDPANPPVNMPAAATLDQINAQVAANERLFNGPLVAIGNDGASNTQLTVDDTKPPRPDPATVIAKDSDPAPSGLTKLFSGTIYIAGTLTACSAWRAGS